MHVLVSTASTQWKHNQIASGENQSADTHALAIAYCLYEGMPACRPRPATDPAQAKNKFP